MLRARPWCQGGSCVAPALEIVDAAVQDMLEPVGAAAGLERAPGYARWAPEALEARVARVLGRELRRWIAEWTRRSLEVSADVLDWVPAPDELPRRRVRRPPAVAPAIRCRYCGRDITTEAQLHAQHRDCLAAARAVARARSAAAGGERRLAEVAAVDAVFPHPPAEALDRRRAVGLPIAAGDRRRRAIERREREDAVIAERTARAPPRRERAGRPAAPAGGAVPPTAARAHRGRGRADLQDVAASRAREFSGIGRRVFAQPRVRGAIVCYTRAASNSRSRGTPRVLVGGDDPVREVPVTAQTESARSAARRPERSATREPLRCEWCDGPILAGQAIFYLGAKRQLVHQRCPQRRAARR